ncbi:uncharacterized protein Tco025E_02275 [Trypanosoma conorhini]|uniref:Uncharacterized protein n=1 Tax=Trypanosoma conorhini TaxID=83891 RepID=A0A422Q5Y9_9TRYP|nr:uncharacterized protein Tco025E_02275 [Trypanosoma conorhini]RNF25371.1 hypothetical protein Tco025E_02275 [Trypanosoma conorhini]
MGCSASKGPKTREDTRGLHGDGSSRGSIDPPKSSHSPEAPSKKKAKAKKRGKKAAVEGPGTETPTATSGTPSWVRPLHAVEISRPKRRHAGPSPPPVLQAVEVRETRVIRPPPPTRALASGAGHHTVSTGSKTSLSSSPFATSSSSELGRRLLRSPVESPRNPATVDERPLPIRTSSSRHSSPPHSDRMERRKPPVALNGVSPARNLRDEGARHPRSVHTSSSSPTTTPTQSTTPTSLVEECCSPYMPREVELVRSATLPPMVPSSRSPKAEKPAEPRVEPPWEKNSRGWDVLEQIRLLLHARNAHVA